MVDALEPIEGDLVVALATLRARLQPHLVAAGVAVSWQMHDLPPIPGLGPRAVLQLLRIVQEAVTNVLKHADARTITIRADVDRDDAGRRSISVVVADDGRGFTGLPRAGRGLHHMRRRAAEVGASLALDGSPHGTRLTLRIPLEGTPVAT
jgi:signal transduction histidine kinase